MTYPFSPAGDGGPGRICPGRDGGPGPCGRAGRPRCAAERLARPARGRRYRDGGPVTVAAARRVIDTFSVPGNLVAGRRGAAARRRSPSAAAAGRRVLVLVPDGSGGYPLPVPSSQPGTASRRGAPTPRRPRAARRARAGPGVPLSIWPGLPEPGGTRGGGPVTVAAARRVIDTFSRPGDLVAPPRRLAGGRRGRGSRRAARPGPRARREQAGTRCPFRTRSPGCGPAARPSCSPPATRSPGRPRWPSPAAAAPALRGQRPGRPGRRAAVRRLRAGAAPRRGPRGHRRPRRRRRHAHRHRRERGRRRPRRRPGLRPAHRAGPRRDRRRPPRPRPGGADAPGGSPVHDDLLVLTKPGGEARS